MEMVGSLIRISKEGGQSGGRLSVLDQMKLTADARPYGAHYYGGMRADRLGQKHGRETPVFCILLEEENKPVWIRGKPLRLWGAIRRLVVKGRTYC